MSMGRARVGRWIAVVACLWLGATLAPCHAAVTARTPDGTVVSVWEVSLRGRAGDGSAVAFSVTDARGSRVGIIPPTGDALRDVGPSVAIDPVSGAPVAVWSRDNGVVFKIAYARFEAGAWVDVHDLTFGPGHDLLPRLGTGATGSYLFWVTGQNRYLYAPLDLSHGRLFGTPQPLLEGGRKGASTGEVLLADVGLLSVQGGTDVPVVVGNSSGIGPGGGKGKASVYAPGDPKKSPPSPPAGGPVVAPVIRALWGVASLPECRAQVVALPERDPHTLLVVRFLDGTVSTIAEHPVSSVIGLDFGEAVAATYLAAACD
jgi:hypothetical protein